MAVSLAGTSQRRKLFGGANPQYPGRFSEPKLWVLSGLVVASAGALFVVVTGAQPAYDAMGFLVWGHQALHWSLNLDGAPSWKPLPFLATLPYAIVGDRAQDWLWTFTAAVGAIAAVPLAGRLAYRLTPAEPGRQWARWVAALVAAFGIATMNEYLRLTLIANSDPLTVTLVLASIDCHLSRRYRLAIVCLWLVALGRPEAWAFLFLYAAWVWHKQPASRWWALASVALTPVLWFVIPAFTSKSALLASDFAMGQASVIHGNKLFGVFGRLRTLTALPLQIAALATVVSGLRSRNRAILWLLALAVLWAAIEVAFALHGYSAVQRYLMEPGAVLIVMIGVGVGTMLSDRAGRMRWLAPLVLVVLVLSLGPFTRSTLRTYHGLVHETRTNALVLDRLADVISASGGPTAILACGQPTTPLVYQSTIAWELNLNVAAVNWHVGAAIDSDAPVVEFTSVNDGWIVKAIHERKNAASCARLDRRFDVGTSPTA